MDSQEKLPEPATEVVPEKSLAERAYEEMVNSGEVQGDFAPWNELPEISRDAFGERTRRVIESEPPSQEKPLPEPPFERAVRSVLEWDARLAAVVV